jgi:hypothetical protein
MTDQLVNKALWQITARFQLIDGRLPTTFNNPSSAFSRFHA